MTPTSFPGRAAAKPLHRHRTLYRHPAHRRHIGLRRPAPTRAPRRRQASASASSSSDSPPISNRRLTAAVGRVITSDRPAGALTSFDLDDHPQPARVHERHAREIEHDSPVGGQQPGRERGCRVGVDLPADLEVPVSTSTMDNAASGDTIANATCGRRDADPWWPRQWAGSPVRVNVVSRPTSSRASARTTGGATGKRASARSPSRRRSRPATCPRRSAV